MVSATVLDVATHTANGSGTIALSDQLIHLRARVPVTTEDVAQATGANERTVTAWLERREAPSGTQAARLNELIAAVERLEVSLKPEAIADWLHQRVPSLDGRTPAQTIAAGEYEQVAGIAEDLIDPPFT